MAKLARAVFVREPGKHRDILLRAGEEPAPELAALILNPACWEGGKLPDAPEGDASSDDKSDEPDPAKGEDAEDAKPAARKRATKKTAPTSAAN